MKKYSLLCLSFFLLLVFSCNGPSQQHETARETETDVPELPEGHYGMMITEEGAVEATSLPELMTDTSSLDLKLHGHIASSCKHSGCWMNVTVGEDKTMTVTFAEGDYTIPLDAEGSEVIFEGTAHKELVPVERLQNYARDEGLTKEEVEKITEPEWEYTFVARGVILR